MKKFTLVLLFCTFLPQLVKGQSAIDQAEILTGLQEVIEDISNSYVYLDQKELELECLRNSYRQKIESLSNQEDVILFFEYLLDELYDDHASLNTNIHSSYRLYAPIYAAFEENKAIIQQTWVSEIVNLPSDIPDAEILKLNGVDIDEIIAQFPTQCHDKTHPKVKEWILNKILAGRYNEPRVLQIKTPNGRLTELDLDVFEFRNEQSLLSINTQENIGIILINNSLGQNALIKSFDDALNQLMDTRGLIIDLRNTASGGNSYVARGIMSRFIEEEKPYQRHAFPARWDGETVVERSWVEYVTPRGEQYQKPVVVLVGRWTGSMGEGLAIGFDGMKRGRVMGAEMARLAGEVNGFSIPNQPFGYQLPTAKLYHVDGQPREKFVPTEYVRQTSNQDETLDYAIQLLLNTK